MSVSRFFSQTGRVANIEESEPQAGETNAMQNSRASEKPTEEEIANGVFIRNMVFDATEDHLREIFEKFGTVVSARIMRDARGLSKGYVKNTTLLLITSLMWNIPQLVHRSLN